MHRSVKALGVRYQRVHLGRAERIVRVGDETCLPCIPMEAQGSLKLPDRDHLVSICRTCLAIANTGDVDHDIQFHSRPGLPQRPGCAVPRM